MPCFLSKTDKRDGKASDDRIWSGLFLVFWASIKRGLFTDDFQGISLATVGLEVPLRGGPVGDGPVSSSGLINRLEWQVALGLINACNGVPDIDRPSRTSFRRHFFFCHLSGFRPSSDPPPLHFLLTPVVTQPNLGNLCNLCNLSNRPNKLPTIEAPKHRSSMQVPVPHFYVLLLISNSFKLLFLTTYSTIRYQNKKQKNN